jgi:Bacterial Ig domain/Bacterial lectin
VTTQTASFRTKVVRALVGLGVSAAAIGLVVSSPASAVASPTLSLPFAESMTGPTLESPDWLLSGSATLTGTETEPGMMQLTPASGGLGSAILNTPISTSETFTIDFDYDIRGSADGMSMFLIDGAETAPAPGAGGGALGYASNGIDPGATSGYVSLGLNEYYWADGGPGFRLMGSGSGTTGYAQIAFTPDYGLSFGSGHAHAIFEHGVVTLDTLTRRVFDHVDLTTVAGQAVLPPTVKLGFAGATGGLTATHQIRNVSVGLQSDSLHVAPSATVNSQTGEFAVTADLTNTGLDAVSDAQLAISASGSETLGPDWTCATIAPATCPAVTTGPIEAIGLPADGGHVTVTQQGTGAVQGDLVTFNLSSASDPTRPRTEQLQLNYPYNWFNSEVIPKNSSENTIWLSNTDWSIESLVADNGTVTESSLDGDRVLLYTPDTDFIGTDTITYSLRKGQILATNYTAQVDVLDNAKPTATWTPPASTPHGAPIDIPLTFVDPDLADTVTVDYSWVYNGCATVDGATLTYDPTCGGEIDFVGTDTVYFTITDGNFYVDYQFDIDVLGPTATTAAATVQEGKSVTIPVTLGDPVSGHVLTLDDSGEGAWAWDGSVVVDGNNLIYTASGEFVGTDTISFGVFDDNGQPSSYPSWHRFTATVTVTANHAPTATAAAAVVETGSSLTIPVTLADVDGDAVELGVAEALHGAVVIEGSNLVYTPNEGYVGEDEISFSFADYLTAGDADVEVTVRPVNSPPTPPVDDDPTPEMSGEADDDFSLVIEGVTDVNGDSLVLDIPTAPAHGTVSIEDVTPLRDGLRAAAIGVNGVRVVYTPNAGFVGADSFTYRVSDGFGGSYSRTVTVNVLAAAVAPPTSRIPLLKSMSKSDRLLDTRAAGGLVTETRVTVNSPQDGAALNVTVVGQKAAGFVTVWPCDKPRPNTSNVNFGVGTAVPNAVNIAPAADGTVCLFSSTPAYLIVDQSASWSTAGGFVGQTPDRMIDTRDKGGKITTVEVPGLDITRATFVNITVIDPKDAGFVTVWPCASPKPATSNVNFQSGETRAAAALVKPDANGKVCMFSSTPADLLMDRMGSLPAGRVDTSHAGRLLDTRNAAGRMKAGIANLLPASTSIRYINVTAVDTTGAGFATIYGDTSPKPTTSNVNFGANVPSSNTTAISAGNGISAYASTDWRVIVDLQAEIN